MNIYGVIMAGGGGTRFWPLSRQEEPKQLLNLSGKDLMVNETIERIATVADKKDIFIVTNVTQVPKMKAATVSKIQENHILAEPSARNTSACIGYAALEIVKKYGDGIMCIFPSDHYIKNTSEFTRVIKEAIKVAEEEDKLLTLGITPTYACTGYGYIKFDKNDAGIAKQVVEFKEKPDEETAKAYIASGEYAWNSGMFIWKASTILRAFEEFLPDVHDCLEKIGAAMGTDAEVQVIQDVYPTIPSISIDYGIMEKSSNVKVISADFGWNDVGSWDMMKVIYDEDAEGNILVGDHVNIDTTNTISFSSGKMIATIGVDNLVVVETEDAILVCDKNRVQDVKKVVDTLNEQGRTDLL